ncbi:hypothetical protein EPO34_01895 [Patescibacteria group bacterium]|nr:MAG: hypothetical protein EPO34_01895 [Patescibacteria group bacterium]
MTSLVISAQDIRRISIGWMEDGKLARTTEVEAEPERYLAAIDETLASWGCDLADAGRVCVVTGPGAFTASRMSVTIANAIAFARNIPVFGIANEEKKSLEQLMGSGAFNRPTPGVGFVSPVYDRPPNITLPKSSNVIPYISNS